MSYFAQVSFDPTTATELQSHFVDEANATTTYVGANARNGTGTQLNVKKIIVSGTVTTITYATIVNNGAQTTLSSAWTNRATLTYTQFNGL